MNRYPSLRSTIRFAIGALTLLLFACSSAQTAVAPTQGTSLSFQEALALAGEASTVISARSQLEIARLDLVSAQSVFQGSVNAGLDSTFGQSTSISGSVSANANLNVVPFGPRADAAERAANAVTRAENDLMTATWDSTLLVVRQYAAAVAAARGTSSAEANLALAEARLRATRQRLKAGAANDAEVLQAEIAVAQASNARATAQAEERAALTDLSITLGRTVEAVVDDLPRTASLDALPQEELRGERIAHRADVITAVLAVAEAESSLASAQREALPTASLDLSLRTSNGGTSLQLGAGFDTNSFQPSASASVNTGGSAGTGSSSTAFSVGLGVSMPLGGSSTNNIVAAEIRLNTARAQLERTLLSAQADIEARVRNLASANAQLELADRLAEQAQDSLAAARTRYDLGLISVLTLEENELALLDARDAARNARDNRLLAAMNLAVALSTDPLEVLR